MAVSADRRGFFIRHLWGDVRGRAKRKYEFVDLINTYAPMFKPGSPCSAAATGPLRPEATEPARAPSDFLCGAD